MKASEYQKGLVANLFDDQANLRIPPNWRECWVVEQWRQHGHLINPRPSGHQVSGSHWDEDIQYTHVTAEQQRAEASLYSRPSL
jgi:hypothetical protein